ncbi:MAG: bifunctional phosphopantothenoylcysteine decarboxylase/phosphopantothenate--cysteine ligase CoaBC [Candidatus Hodarchaeales archaeon]
MGTHEIFGTKGNRLKDKRILIGVTGSIAAIEVPHLVREILRYSGQPIVMLTPEAERFVAIDALTWSMGKPPLTEISGLSEHIKFTSDPSYKVDLCLICPATANTISKIANGIADTSVTLTALASLGAKIPILVVPAAHTVLLENPILERNISYLEKQGVIFFSAPEEENKFKFPNMNQLIDQIFRVIEEEKTLTGKTFLVTGGATREYFDDVRFISNPSSGITALLVCKSLIRKGAGVKLILGEGNLVNSQTKEVPTKIVRSTQDMYENVRKELLDNNYDAFISIAAVSDYSPDYSAGKIPSKQNNLKIILKPTVKIVKRIREEFPDLYIVAFKAEVGLPEKDLLDRASKLLNEYNLQIVCANWVGEPNRGFISSNNELFIIQNKSQKPEHFKGSKSQFAEHLVEIIVKNFKSGGKIQ